MTDVQKVFLDRLNEIEKALFGDDIPRDILTCDPATPWDNKTFPCRLEYLETNSADIDNKTRRLNQIYTNNSLLAAEIVAKNKLTSASQESASLTAALNSWDAKIREDLAFWTSRVELIRA